MDNSIYHSNLENRKAKYTQFVADQIRNDYKFPILFALLHLPLGIILYNAGLLGLLHPLIVFLVGMRHALIKEEKLVRSAQVAAYLVGVEVLWRMASVPVFWEFGKYGIATIMITALLRRGLWKIPVFPIFYFVLLLPSCLITIIQESPSQARSILSSNLSGPFTLLICCWFFSHIQMTKQQVKKLFWILIIPLMSVAITTLFYTVTASDIEFNGESNFATSGGFGPNQVSSMLGLGVFLCVACFLLFKNTFKQTLFLGASAMLLTSQSLLTFSRGGIYNAVGGILLIVFFQMQSLKDGIKRLLPVVGIAALFLFLIFPVLDNFTGGALLERFEDRNTTKRADIVETDLKIFAKNPILGVGIGKAYEEREKYLDYKAMSHTEFGRVISEHGIFGVASLFAMILMVISNFRRQNSIFGRALMVGLIGWSTLFMLNAGMRLAAASFIWGMSYLIAINFTPRNPEELEKVSVES